MAPDAEDGPVSERMRRIRERQRAAGPITPEIAAAALTQIAEVLTRTGAHAEHQQEQVGPCVYCSCGARVQGRKKAR